MDAFDQVRRMYPSPSPGVSPAPDFLDTLSSASVSPPDPSVSPGMFSGLGSMSPGMSAMPPGMGAMSPGSAMPPGMGAMSPGPAMPPGMGAMTPGPAMPPGMGAMTPGPAMPPFAAPPSEAVTGKKWWKTGLRALGVVVLVGLVMALLTIFLRRRSDRMDEEPVVEETQEEPDVMLVAWNAEEAPGVDDELRLVGEAGTFQCSLPKVTKRGTRKRVKFVLPNPMQVQSKSGSFMSAEDNSLTFSDGMTECKLGAADGPYEEVNFEDVCKPAR